MTVEDYLELHGINKSSIEKFGLRVCENKLIIPIKDENDRIIFNKYRHLNQDGPKFSFDSGSQVSLFNKGALKNSYVFIVEGEIDCMRLDQEGVSSITGTGGAGTFKVEWADLLVNKKVYICLDNDEAGRKGTSKLLGLLSDALVVELPDGIKDICEYFKKFSLKEYQGLCRKALTKSEWSKKYPELKSTSQSIYSNDLLTKDNPRLELISLDDLTEKDFPPNKWIINYLVPENGITCISGKPKVGKSFWALYLAICLAKGSKFLDQFETQQGAVLFISKEDPQRLIKERVQLLNNDQNLPIYFCTDSQLLLDTDSSLKDIVEIIKEKNIKVIIIDSFRRIFKGEENSSQVISDVHNRFKILLEYGISLIFIHHHGKEGFFKREAGDKLRGSSDILAMLDCLLIVERKDDQTLKISQGALRSDKPVESFLVKFPNFEEENDTFKFLNYIEAEVEKIDHAKEDISLLLGSGMKNQKEIIQNLTPSGKYGPTTIKNALKSLLESKKIDCIPQGNKKLYLLIDQLEQDGELE